MPTGRRKDQFRASITCDGRDLGIWDTFAGGAVDSDELKYKPGGLQPEISLGGQVTVTNFTAQKIMDSQREQDIIDFLIARVGKAQVTGKKQPLDEDGNALGKGQVYRGILKTVTPPEHDSNANDAAVTMIEVSSAGTVG